MRTLLSVTILCLTAVLALRVPQVWASECDDCAGSASFTVSGNAPPCVDPTSIVITASTLEDGICTGIDCPQASPCVFSWSLQGSSKNQITTCSWSHIVSCGPVIGPPQTCSSGGSSGTDYSQSSNSDEYDCDSRVEITFGASGVLLATINLQCDACP